MSLIMMNIADFMCYYVLMLYYISGKLLTVEILECHNKIECQTLA